MSTNKVEAGTKTLKDADKLKKIDFKMISFTLAGRDYGIDILKVKEIRKAGNFTKVPNTPIFVKGVDNLRGDIIPIIDLRVMFNLPAETKEENALENIIILRLQDLVLGVVVDSIEKVVGVSKASIQPPHPIFGDINIKYINGVIENEGRLYIILDVDRIFVNQDTEVQNQNVPPATVEREESTPTVSSVPTKSRTQDNIDFQFVQESLQTFGNFSTTSVNEDWVRTRLESWKTERKAAGMDFQFNNKEDSEAFLKSFYSPFTGQLWSRDALDFLSKNMSFTANNLMIWNPGCGKGFESYSIALFFELFYSGKLYKVWANDNDLLHISSAPSLILEESEVPDEYKPYTVKSKTGVQFNSDIKSRILFEFHDINHLNPFTDVHLVLVRDLISFLKPNEQEKLISEITEKVKSGGYLIVGKNERIVQESEWTLVSQGDWTIYQRV